MGAGIPPGFLSLATMTVLGCGVFAIAASVFGWLAFRVPLGPEGVPTNEDDEDLKRLYLQICLYICIIEVPVALLLMLGFASTVRSDFVRAYLDLNSMEGIEADRKRRHAFSIHSWSLTNDLSQAAPLPIAQS